MDRAFAKSGRIGQIERLLLTSRVPLSQAEIARRCDVDRSTIHRLIEDMFKQGIPLRLNDKGWLYIEKTAYISTLKFSLHESIAVFLAGRLLARYSDKPNMHTVAALEKLGTTLQAIMPSLGHHITQTSTALRGQMPKQISSHQQSLEKLTEAWARGTKVQLWYRPLNSQRALQHTFSPYFLEPSAIGYSTYVIGLAEPPGALRTRKLERIERVVATDEPFEVPQDFDPNALLAGAWGIWFDADDQPVTIKLRFNTPRTIKRMEETVWHPSEQKTRDAEGRLVWMGEIDEPQEMLPWIRGWGGDCEVLEPIELREQVMGEVRRQMRMYGINEADSDDRSQRFNDIFG